MLKRILGLVILSFILSSYDPPGHHLAGVVIDKNTLTPINNAQITILENNILHTDSLGCFEIMLRGGIGSGFEIFVEKRGYQPKYINFSEAAYNPDTAVIKLQPIYKAVKPILSRNQLRFINSLIKIAFSLLNVFTLIFILINSEIRWQYVWITGILFINLIFNLLYLDFNLISYEIVHAPFFLTGYWNNPYSLKIAIPVVSIIFWILYFLRRNLIKEEILEIRNESKNAS
jgi:hypothetical protein